MTRTIRVASLLVIATFCSQPTFAGMFTWGDLEDPAGDIMFLDVTEDNAFAAPLFDEDPNVGSPDVIGNQISFNPQGFQSQSSGGGPNLIDSTLTTTLMAKPGKTIQNFRLSELGDYSLGGLPGGDAIAQVGAPFFWTILEIDNVANPQPVQSTNMIFTTGGGPNGGEYARGGDDGTGVIWEGEVFIDLAAYLDSENIAGDVTKVRIRFNNTLQTASDSGSNAFIKKKEAGGVIITGNIPEPSTVVLAGLAGIGLLGFRRLSTIRG